MLPGGMVYCTRKDKKESTCMFTMYRERLLAQLSLELNCAPGDLLGEGNVITVPALREGRRRYSPGAPFLSMATLGGGAVISADERLHGFLRGLVKDAEGHRLFELGNLSKLNGELAKYGYEMAPTHHMFLPCRETAAEEGGDVRWFLDGEIAPFYGDPRFPNAICYPEPCPDRPDRIAAAAYDGGAIMGMAGCSEDAPHWQQIGIDVLPPYRGRGLAVRLVTLVKNRIVGMGDVPFYGTAAANVRSQNVALACGFKPAWVETEAVKIKAEE